MADVRARRRRQTRHRCFKCGGNWNGRGVHDCAPTSPGGSVAALEELRLGIRTLSRDLSSLSKTSVEPRAISVLQDAVEVLRETTRAPLPREATSTQVLSIALAGRTKAGKSQLVAALTGDIEGSHIGIGKQRTTRKTTTHVLADFKLFDTPGVAALDGEKDTTRALEAMEAADAVLWLYAESLQDEEAEQLEDLLRRGKPVVIAYNAKTAVDKAERRRIFSLDPGFAFRDLRGHETRVEQIAGRAGTNIPPFLPVHARAAWWALKTEDPTAATTLREASRIENLEASCRELLLSRSEALRVQKTYDRRRIRLGEYAASCTVISNLLCESPNDMIAEFRAEANKLVRAIACVARNADVRLKADVASARADLPRWLKKHKGNPADSWNQYLDDHHLFAALEEFGAEVARECERHGTLFEATTALRERFKLRRAPTDKPSKGWLSKLRSTAKVVAKAGLRILKDLGISRGVSKVLAKVSSRFVPGAGWAVAAADVLGAVSAETRAEIKKRRLDTESWERDTRGLFDEELDQVSIIVARRLRESRERLLAEVRNHYTQAEAIVAQRPAQSKRANALRRRALAAISECDREFVLALADTQGLTVEVTAANRTPGRVLRIEITGPTSASEVERTLRPLLLNEKIIVTTGSFSARKQQTR